MRFDFKKISAIGTSLLMTGMTLGVGAAANYPSPFVRDGAADVAIIYGSSDDMDHATTIQNNLAPLVTERSSNVRTSSGSGDRFPLFKDSKKIYLGESLTSGGEDEVRETDIEDVLGETRFEGNEEVDLTHKIFIGEGSNGSEVGSGKIIFEKQPDKDNDPVIGISLGDENNPLYTASVSFNDPIDFTDEDSEGQEITLFGQTFTVSSDTDDEKLVLFKESEKIELTSEERSRDLTDYEIFLINADSDEATIRVVDSNGRSDEDDIDEGDSAEIQGLNIYLDSVYENFDETWVVRISLGDGKITLEDGEEALLGDDDDIPGTMVEFEGTVDALDEIRIKVFDSDEEDRDAILEGEVFVDPLFGTFQFEFDGLSSSLDDSSRGTIEVEGGSGIVILTLTPYKEKSEDSTTIYYSDKGNSLGLSTDDDKKIHVWEGANISEEDLVMVGTPEGGYLLELTNLNFPNDRDDYKEDKIEFEDVFTGKPVTGDVKSDGEAEITVGGEEYLLLYDGNDEESGVTIKYPDESDDIVLYPAIKTKNGAFVALYEPLEEEGLDGETLLFHNGDDSSYEEIETSEFSNDVEVGQLSYKIVDNGNNVSVKLNNPENTSETIDNPAVIIFEGENDDSEHQVIVIELKKNNDDDDVGVKDVYFTAQEGMTWEDIELESDDKLKQSVDWWGTLVEVDDSESSQRSAILKYPESQVEAMVYVSEVGSSDSSISSFKKVHSNLGEVLVKDSEVSSVENRNLIVVGGSCVNSVAAELLGVGSSTCGSAWQANTGIGSGEFLIESFGDSSVTNKMALLVAGYESADTRAAATYLTTQEVDTSSGMRYRGNTQARTAQVVSN